MGIDSGKRLPVGNLRSSSHEKSLGSRMKIPQWSRCSSQELVGPGIIENPRVRGSTPRPLSGSHASVTILSP